MVLYSTSLGVTNSGDQKRVWVANISQVEQVPNPLPYFMLLASFYTPLRDRKTSGFLMFSRGIE